MDIDAIFDKIRDFMRSDEGKRSMDEYANELERKDNILQMQLDRMHNRNLSPSQFSALIQKIQTKYNSDKYVDTWYNRRIEPPEDLYYFLFSYAKKHGKPCGKKQWEKFSNCFTSELYFIKGYFFNLMHGQGTAIEIIKNDIRSTR